MTTMPDSDVFADVTRTLMTEHNEWDSLATFTSLHWDGKEATFGTMVAFDPRINPNTYPQLMRASAEREIEEHRKRKARDATLYGYVLQAEAYAVLEPGPDATDAERRQFMESRRNRRHHERADAIEIAMVYCMDIHQRLWSSTKWRGHSQDIVVDFYPTTRTPLRPDGNLIDGLTAAVFLARRTVHGLM